jgi:hypothetical protein
MSSLERLLAILLGLLAVSILAGAILIMFGVDRGSISQGGRIYVAIAALVLLGAVETQVVRLMVRRLPFSLTTTPQQRRYGLTNLLVMLVCGAGLVGLGLLLP